MPSPPEFPPLIAGHPVAAGADPMRVAAAGAASGRLGAGDLCWSEGTEEAVAALVLEPESPLDVALQMVPLMAVAVCDALGAIGPPNLALNLRWPSGLVANGGAVGQVTATWPEGTGPDAVPDHLVVGFRIALILPEALRRAPGQAAHRTALHEEGCGDIDRSAVVGAVARHFLSWLDAWQHEGFRAVHAAYAGWLGEGAEVAGARLVGLDERGGAIVETAQGRGGISIAQGLEADG